jgi:glycosyltransferase involved in cell wall biosynthesis
MSESSLDGSDVESDLDDVVVSVIIPYSPEHTPEDMLEEAKECANNQTVETQLLVIEDQEQQGPAWARNVGMDRAETRYIAFLDGDDLWVEDELEQQLHRMRETGAGLCVEGSEPKSTGEFIRGILADEIMALTSSIVIDTEKVAIRFDETLRRREDHLFLIEAADIAGVCFVPDIMTARKYEYGLSATVETSVDEATRFFERVVETVPEVKHYHDLYWKVTYTYQGWTRHQDGEYWQALQYYFKSLSYGLTVKAIGATVLTLLAIVQHYSVRALRKGSRRLG